MEQEPVVKYITWGLIQDPFKGYLKFQNCSQYGYRLKFKWKFKTGGKFKLSRDLIHSSLNWIHLQWNLKLLLWIKICILHHHPQLLWSTHQKISPNPPPPILRSRYLLGCRIQTDITDPLISFRQRPTTD